MIHSIKQFDDFDLAEGNSRKCDIPYTDQKRIVEEHETLFNKIYKKHRLIFSARKNKPKLSTLKKEVRKFREKILYDVKKFNFYAVEDIMLLRELYDDVETVIRAKKIVTKNHIYASGVTSASSGMQQNQYAA